ncbi:MAG: hypothetical protein OXR73_10180 [Myxococcales bacterium]|nr:hypothetical protein [Myxococcales bacterium]
MQRLQRFAEEASARFAAVPIGTAAGYRHRARLAVRGRAASPKLGLFQAGTHRIVDIPACLVHHPRINAVADAVKAAVRESGFSPYADGPHRGLIRYVQVMLDAAAEHVQLVVVTNSDVPEDVSALWPLLQDRLGASLQGLFWNGHPTRDNAVLGSHWQRIAGEPALGETICGTRVFFPPDAFAQNNPAVYRQIVAQVGSWVPDGSDLVEFYAGVGAIGLSQSTRARSVVFNELGEGSLRGLSMGIEALPKAAASRTRIHSGRAGEHANLVAQATTVVVDPPRKGLDTELLDALCEAPPRLQTLIYLSCGPKAWMEEARRLQPVLPLREVIVHDLFPWTGHVEVLARFAR